RRAPVDQGERPAGRGLGGGEQGDHVVPGGQGTRRAAEVRGGHVEQYTRFLRKPAGELGAGHGPVEAPVGGQRVGGGEVRRGGTGRRRPGCGIAPGGRLLTGRGTGGRA